MEIPLERPLSSTLVRMCVRAILKLEYACMFTYCVELLVIFIYCLFTTNH